MPTYSLTTLGCKVNQYESSALTATLRARGFRPAGEGDRVDLVVVNTCCVTVTAMRKSRQALRKALRSAPGAAVFVAGCYNDYDTRKITQLLASMEVPPERQVLAGHHGDVATRLEHLLKLFSATFSSSAPTNSGPSDSWTDEGRYDQDIKAARASGHPVQPYSNNLKARRQQAVLKNAPGANSLGPIDRFDGHQRAFVKVQDGCGAFCTYCIVAYNRPNVFSRELPQVVQECRTLVAAGHKEIVLCGVFLGAYGRATAIRRKWDDRPSLLPELLRQIAAIDGLWRVRLSSLEPGDVTDELLSVYRDTPTVAPRVCTYRCNPDRGGSSRR